MIGGPAAGSGVATAAPGAPRRVVIAPERTGRLSGSLLVLSAILPAVAALAVLGAGARGMVSAVFLAALGLLAAIDLERQLLPNKIVLPAAAVVLSAQVALFPEHALEWVLAALGAFAGLLILALLRPGGLGMGDVKLGLLLGAGLGADVGGAILIGFAAIWPVSVWLLVRYGRAGCKRPIPFGPFLALGAAMVALT